MIEGSGLWQRDSWLQVESLGGILVVFAVVGTCEACERNRLAANIRSVPRWLNGDSTGIVADGVEAVEIANSAADLYGDPKRQICGRLSHTVLCAV